MIAFSPGIVQGCFELLSIMSRNNLSFPQIRSSFASFGSLPCAKIIEATQELGWSRAIEDGTAALTPSGAQLLLLTSYERMLRQALLDYIGIAQPPWVQNASFGRARVISFAGSSIGQVFVEAGLAHGTDSEVVLFWDTLAARAMGQRNDRLTEIGRMGERLTIAFELERTGRNPKWIAIDNNDDGYDVLSCIKADDLRSLCIEVKASTQGASGRFHVTRNEWERAQESENHAFHLWDIQSANATKLAVVPFEEMNAHIPSDNGSGVWEVTEIPFAAFSERFVPIHG